MEFLTPCPYLKQSIEDDDDHDIYARGSQYKCTQFWLMIGSDEFKSNYKAYEYKINSGHYSGVDELNWHYFQELKAERKARAQFFVNAYRNLKLTL